MALQAWGARKDERTFERILEALEISRECPNVQQNLGYSIVKNEVCIVMELYVESLEELIDGGELIARAQPRSRANGS